MKAMVLCLVAPFLLAAFGAADAPPAFPGAEGFGRQAIGGRGGRVLQVTTLASQGPGSLREACEASGPRIVVFRVGGVIDLGNRAIEIVNPNITIAGQTAPGDGICIRNSRVTIRASEVIVRHLRFRPGDDPRGDLPRNRDAFGIGTGKQGGAIGNILIDHCSMSWGIDGNLDIFNNNDGITSNVTVQYCILSESLSDSLHIDEGKKEIAPHGMACLIGARNANLCLHGNLLAHNADRNPLITGDPVVTSIVFANNIVYDWGPRQNTNELDGQAQPTGYHATKVNWQNRVDIINNYYKRGPAGSGAGDVSISITAKLGDPVSRDHRIFISGNALTTPTLRQADSFGDDETGDPQWRLTRVGFRLDNPADARTITRRARADGPWSASHGFQWMSAAEAYETLPAVIGATRPKRDAIDTRVIHQLKTGAGAIIDDLKLDLGYDGVNQPAYPVYESGAPCPDADQDGMDDDWEASWGLNPANPADGSAWHESGYTWVEIYLNQLADGKIELGDKR